MTRRRLLKLALPLGVVMAAIVAVAFGFFTSSGSGSASGSIATFPAPANVTATVTAGQNDVSVDWDATALSVGTNPAQGYYVTKTDGSSNTTAACGSSSSSLITSATDCTDTDAPDEVYTYKVIAVFNSWTATGTAADVTHVATETDAPTAAFTFPADTGQYNATTWDAGCTTAGLCGTATDPTGGSGAASGVHTVEVAIQQGSGNYYDGTSFASATQTFLPATFSSGNWSFAFDNTKFPADGSYTVSVRSTDWGGNTSTVASNTFTYDNQKPGVTVAAARTATNSQPVDFNVTFDEPVSDLDASGVTVSAPAANTGLTKSVEKTDSQHFIIHVSGLQTDSSGDGNIDASVNASAVTDVAGNSNTASNSATSVWDRTTPTLSTLAMQDTNNNGKVDHVVATFSEALQTTSDTAPWTLSNVPSGGTLASVARTGAGQNQITLTLNEGAGAPDTTVGSFTVALAASATGVRDVAGNEASFADTAPADGAAPARTSLVMQDQDSNGKVDRVVATYSEPIQSTTDASLWTLTNVPSGGTKGAVTSGTNTVTIAINEGAGAPDTSVGSFRVSYVTGATGVKDAANNQAISINNAAPSDGATPIRLSLSMVDNNANGKVDRVVATYSETLAATTDNTLWTLANIPSGGTKGNVSRSGAVVTLLITEGAGAADTSVGSFTVAYTAGATGVADPAGNQAGSFAAEAPADGAAPIRTSMVMQDNNGNGKVDRVVATYSETIQSTTDAARWTLANVPSGGTKDTVTSSTNTVTINITEGAGAANTAVGTFTVAYTAAATGVTDASSANNQSPTVTGTAPSDGAAPVRTGLDIRDNNTNGKIDRVVATYSENLAATTDATLWTFGGAVPSGGTKGAVSATTNAVTILITEGAGAADTTVGTFTVAYTAGATGAKDSSNNQAVSIAATPPSDAAGPVPILIADNDTSAGGDGKFEATNTMTVTFSEPIIGLPSTSDVTLTDKGAGGNNDGVTMTGLISGTANLNAALYSVGASGTSNTFNASAVSQTAGTNTFTITLGAVGGAGTVGQNTTAQNFVYTPASTITDAASNPAAGSRTQSIRLF